MPSSDHNSPQQTSTDTRNEIEDDDVARMRLALGLRETPRADHHAPPQQRPEQARPKHRFAKDGDVPVVMLHTRREPEAAASPRNRMVVLESSLQAERSARTAAERATHEAQGVAQTLRTQIAHAELAHREALAAATARRLEVENALEQALLARSAAEAEARRLAADVASLNRSLEAKAATPPAVPAQRAKAAAPKRKAGRTPTQKPVKWWLPAYRMQAE